ncbi:degenerin-like protein unc-105 [Ptychodera flava]|uniref:degenerin-like protein unc-105 n=1 Tax=Ptychodera flava TaxID=63121 RepID=UPI00396AABA9
MSVETELMNGIVLELESPRWMTRCSASLTLSFSCNNSKCIPSELTCDYIDNCGDFSDEDNCTYLADCGSDSFQCSSNEGEVHCIPGYLRCDRIKHCRNGKDEDGCEYPTNTGFFDVFAENWTHPYHDITTASRYYDKFREDVYLPNLIDFVSNDTSPSLIPLLLASTSPTFDDVRAALMMTAGEMHQFGHQADDAILECSYNGMECETEDFTVSQHENFGNCFTFNNKEKGRLKVEKPGPAHGLELLLSAELYEYVGVYGGRSGFKVVIHDRDVMPFPDNEGFYASPGTFISASLESSVISRLSAPYGDCSSEYSSVKECEAMCLVKHVEDYCGCRPADVMEEMADNNTTEICDRRNQTQDMCLQLMKYFSTRGLLTCDCRLPCSETKYRSTITQSPWPSSKYVPYLLNSLHFSNNKTWTLTDETSVSNNLVSLEVYFETLSEQHVTAEPAYTMSALMMDVGLFLAIWMTLALLVVVLGYVCCGPKGETGQEADEVKVNHVDNVKNANSVNVSLDEITEQDTMDTKL